MVWREEVVLLQDRKQGLPLRAATPLGPAAFGAATRARHQRVRLRCRIPPLHALFGGVLVSTEDRLLLQELPQGLQGRGAGVSGSRWTIIFCLRHAHGKVTRACCTKVPSPLTPAGQRK